MDFKKMSEDFAKWLDSPEGEASIKKFHEELEQAELFKERIDTKLHNYLSTLTDDELSILVDKFVIWEDKQQSLLLDRGIDDCSLLFSRLGGMAKRFGVELPEQNEMFYGYGYDYRGYQFKTYHGQGSFTSLSKGDERYI
jgi:hypothetical protein